MRALGTTLAALFGFVPFLPRLARAVVTGAGDRARMLERIRAGLATQAEDGPEPRRRPVRVFLVAGEPSGDLHAADLAAAILRLNPEARIEGLGGPRMAAAGVEIVEDLVSDPVMGVLPVLARLPWFFRLYRGLLERFETDPPDVLVGVDYPGLNMRLGAAARRVGIPVVTYIAPQVWAWAPWRARRLAAIADKIVAILPFEREVFAAEGGDVAYVGHPLFRHLAEAPRDDSFRARLRGGPAADRGLVALLPGSRRSEVADNLPLLLDAARRVAAERPGTRFVVPLATERIRQVLDAVLAAAPAGSPHVDVAPPEHSDDAMAAADAAIAVSGTATLHLVAHGTPAVVVYHASAAGRWLARVLLVSPYIALPNLLSGERVLPEFLAGPGDAAAIAAALLRLLPGGPDREAASKALAALRDRLDQPGVPDRAARFVLAAAS